MLNHRVREHASSADTMTNSQYQVKPHPIYGFLQIHPTPSQDEIAKFYAEEFYTNYPRFNASALDAQVTDREWLNACRGELCDSLREILGRELTGLSVLDIGCGWGEALLYFQTQGLSCHGFDPAREAVEYASKMGLDVRHAGVETMNVFNDRRFDVVCLFNVLEHLADPVAALEEIKEA